VTVRDERYASINALLEKILQHCMNMESRMAAMEAAMAKLTGMQPESGYDAIFNTRCLLNCIQGGL